MNYKDAKAFAKAYNIVSRVGFYYSPRARSSGRTVIVVHDHWQVVYSPQEICIKRRGCGKATDYGYHHIGPTGTSWQLLPHDKQYVSFQNESGQQVYYLIPKKGLRLRDMKEGRYKALNPIPDYRVSVDTRLAKEARAKHKDALNFFSYVWDAIDRPGPDWKPQREAEKKIDLNDRETWLPYATLRKYAYAEGRTWKTWYRSSVERAKEPVLGELRKMLNAHDLAYKVEPRLPTDPPHSNEYWPQIEALRAAGRLIEFEGEPKKVKKPRTGEK